jgi:hydroxyethylthiazole kinase-like uncharacterized protein yjeF
MAEILTAKQMQAVEQAAIDRGDVTGLTLMERAGQAVVQALFDHWPEWLDGARRALVLCGPGNNGGDGFVIASLLHDAGWTVQVYLLGDEGKLPPDARTSCERWRERGEVLLFSEAAAEKAPEAELVIDALFGTGLSRPLASELSAAFSAFADKGSKLLAVDCLSGLDADSGRLLVENDEPAMQADLTVTFHRAKLGHFLARGPGLSRRLTVANIGLGEGAAQDLGSAPRTDTVRLVDPAFGQATGWPATQMGKPDPSGHKYDHGHAVVFSGGVGKGGAARMAARAALRAGAGLVTILCSPAALIENACHLDAIMLSALKDDTPLEYVVDDRVSAYCLGPGLGITDRTRARVAEVLGRRGKSGRDPAVVLDADALTAFADNPDGLFAKLHGRAILTPHEGEFGRLFPDLALGERGDRSKVEVAREAARRAGCIVLLKGQDTVIAGPHGAASVHATAYSRATPWLATAGAGDTLAGLIAGLAAPKGSASLFQMAEIACYLHAEAARSFGPGLIAEDLAEELPKVFRALGL